MKYRAVYEREPDGRWTVEIPDIPGCHTYGRTIDQARERLHEALSLYKDDAAAEFVDDVKLPDRVLKTIRAAKGLRDTVAQNELKMVQAQIKAVRTLRSMKLGHRDAGVLLGLSHQRVQQLEVHGGVMTADVRSSRRHVARKAAKKR